MPVIFAPVRGPQPGGLSALGNLLRSSSQRIREGQDRRRMLDLQERRIAAEEEDRKARADYRNAQMEQMDYNRGRQERADVMEDVGVQAADLVNQAGAQQDELKKILSGIGPTQMQTPGLVDLQGNEIAGTAGTTEMDTSVKAPTIDDLISGQDKTVTVPGFGNVEERKVSVADKAHALLSEKRRAHAEERMKGGLKTFFDPTTHEYVNAYEGEAREKGYMPKAAGDQFFKEKAATGRGGSGTKPPEGRTDKDGNYWEYINGKWTMNEAISKAAQDAKELEGKGDPREANEIQTRYRDELSLKPGTQEYAAQFEQEYPADYEAVMSMVRGEIPTDKLAAMRNGRREFLLSMAQKITGRNFNAAQVRAMAKTREGFASGRESNNLNRINTAFDHVAQAKDAVDRLNETFMRKVGYTPFTSIPGIGLAIDEGQFPLANKGLDYISEHLGIDADLKEVDKLLIGVATEVAGALKGGNAAPTEKEIDHQLRGVSSQSSPEAIRGFLEASSRLLAGRVQSLEDQWSRVFRGTPDEQYPGGLLSEHARKSLERAGLDHVLSEPGAFDPLFEAHWRADEAETYGGYLDGMFPADGETDADGWTTVGDGIRIRPID